MDQKQNNPLTAVFKESLARARTIRDSLKDQETNLESLGDDFTNVTTHTILRQNFSSVYNKYMHTRPPDVISIVDLSQHQPNTNLTSVPSRFQSSRFTTKLINTSNSSAAVPFPPSDSCNTNNNNNSSQNNLSASSIPTSSTTTGQTASSNNLPAALPSRLTDSPATTALPASPVTLPGSTAPPEHASGSKNPTSATNSQQQVPEIQIPTQALINILTPNELKLWQLQRRNEELTDRLYETHVILDIIMAKYRELNNTLSRYEKSQERGDFVRVPVSQLNEFRQAETRKCEQLAKKVDETMGMLKIAADYEDDQHCANIEQIQRLKIHSSGLRETLVGSERAREIAVESERRRKIEEKEGKRSAHASGDVSFGLGGANENTHLASATSKQSNTSFGSSRSKPLNQQQRFYLQQNHLKMYHQEENSPPKGNSSQRKSSASYNRSPPSSNHSSEESSEDSSTGSSSCSSCSTGDAVDVRHAPAPPDNFANDDSDERQNGDDSETSLDYIADCTVDAILKETQADFEEQERQQKEAGYDWSDSDSDEDDDELELRRKQILGQMGSIASSRLLGEDSALPKFTNHGDNSLLPAGLTNGWLHDENEHNSSSESDEHAESNIGIARLKMNRSVDSSAAHQFVVNAMQSIESSRKSEALPQSGDVLFGQKMEWPSATSPKRSPVSTINYGRRSSANHSPRGSPRSTSDSSGGSPGANNAHVVIIPQSHRLSPTNSSSSSSSGGSSSPPHSPALFRSELQNHINHSHASFSNSTSPPPLKELDPFQNPRLATSPQGRGTMHLPSKVINTQQPQSIQNGLPDGKRARRSSENEQLENMDSRHNEAADAKAASPVSS